MTDRRLSRRAAHGARVIEMTVPPPRLFVVGVTLMFMKIGRDKEDHSGSD